MFKLNLLSFSPYNLPLEFWMKITDIPPTEPADRGRMSAIILDISVFTSLTQSSPQYFPFNLSNISSLYFVITVLLHRFRLFSNQDYHTEVLSFQPHLEFIYALDKYFENTALTTTLLQWEWHYFIYKIVSKPHTMTPKTIFVVCIMLRSSSCKLTPPWSH